MGLAEDILRLVRGEPGLKAIEIGERLGIDRRDVNAVLYRDLKGHVRQDPSYGWTAVSGGSAAPSVSKVEPTASARFETRKVADTVVGRLCRYYLECISFDEQLDIGLFASSKHDLDYAELSQHPVISGDLSVLSESEDARRLVGVASSPRNQKSIFLGHAVVAKKIRSRRGWEGFILHPLLIHTLSVSPGESGLGLRSDDDLPVWNLEALRAITGQSGSAVMEELSALQESLGLVGDGVDLPTFDELLFRLRDVRPDWPWVEVLEPYQPCADSPLSHVSEPGIYNRSLLFVAERPPFTRGLEAELHALSERPADELRGTVLGHLVGLRSDSRSESAEQNPLLEVLPLNPEQRNAVHRSLTSPLTIISGPPGTGKSQVVSSILINAAYQGQHVLFASKNNKAVDVVETRVNALGPRPLLVRLGANAYQDRIVEFLSALLSVSGTEDDQATYELHRRAHASVSERLGRIQSDIESYARQLSSLAERAQRLELEQSVHGASALQCLESLSEVELQKIASHFRRCLHAVDPAQGGIFKKLGTKLFSERRARKLVSMANECRAVLCDLGVQLPPDFQHQEISRWYEAAGELDRLIEVRRLVANQERDVRNLSSLTSLEKISQQELELSEQLEEASQKLWEIWLVLQPSRLSADQRRLVGEYATTLRALQEQIRESGQQGQRFSQKYAELFPKISEVLPCWAVTSLSVHRRVPLSPGFFDLVVIDEASQCDIASIVPLLYRARRAVIIGDPKQLRHIAALRHDQNARLLEKHGLSNDQTLWDYVNNSVYDLCMPLTPAEDVIDLREHHRSHSDIIEFSNRAFYDGKLRVATRYSKLKTTSGEAAVRWVSIVGRVEQVATGGSRNRIEAEAVLKELRRILVEQGYKGTIGVVSPFRAQANLIREMVTADLELASLIPSSELLVDTVHRFQGDERDVMIFSPVVSEGIRDGSLAFLRHSPHLFNVAITRARAALIVVGDKVAAESSGIEYLAAFARYATELTPMQSASMEASESRGAEYPTVARPELVSDWERRFYSKMYDAGLRPIPQYDVEKYTLDFALIDGARRLDIEVDGEQHRAWTGDLCRRDIMRNQRMIELGWDVIRFWVYELNTDMDACIARINRWELGSPSDC